MNLIIKEKMTITYKVNMLLVQSLDGWNNYIRNEHKKNKSFFQSLDQSMIKTVHEIIYGSNLIPYM